MMMATWDLLDEDREQYGDRLGILFIFMLLAGTWLAIGIWSYEI